MRLNLLPAGTVVELDAQALADQGWTLKGFNVYPALGEIGITIENQGKTIDAKGVTDEELAALVAKLPLSRLAETALPSMTVEEAASLIAEKPSRSLIAQINDLHTIDPEGYQPGADL